MIVRRFLHPVLSLCLLAAASMPLRAQEEASKQPNATPTPEGTKVTAELAEAAKKRITKPDPKGRPDDYELGPIKINSARREVRIPCQLNMADGILEYALVHENGKTHESLLRTTVSPMEMNIALLLCHFEPHIKEAAQYLKEPTPMTQARMAQPMEHEGANRMRLTLEWKDASGQTRTAPIGAWIRDKQTGKPSGQDIWTFTGSFISQTGFAAEHDGSHIAIYFDLVSLVNFPDKNNGNDENWIVESQAVPPVDTPVTLVFSPVSASPTPAK